MEAWASRPEYFSVYIDTCQGTAILPTLGDTWFCGPSLALGESGRSAEGTEAAPATAG
jgi:hypothetical protein